MAHLAHVREPHRRQDFDFGSLVSTLDGPSWASFTARRSDQGNRTDVDTTPLTTRHTDPAATLERLLAEANRSLRQHQQQSGTTAFSVHRSPDDHANGSGSTD
jgi:hypothetical protein